MSDGTTSEQPDRIDLILIEVGRLAAGLTGVRGDLTGLKGEFAGLGAEVTGLKGEFAGLRAEVTDLREEVTGLIASTTSLRVDLMDRMDRLQNALTEIRDDIGVNMGRADAAIHANENTREEVRGLSDQVSVMWRQIKRLEAKVRDITGEP